MTLDTTLTGGQSGHIPDHQEIAKKLNAYIDAMAEYSAVGDNSNDDTAEIQAALDAKQADGGGTVTLGPGTFKISSPLVIGDVTTLLGSGQEVTTIHSTHAGTAIFMGSSDVASGSPPTIHSRVAFFSMNGPGATTAGSVGLEVRKAKRGRAHDIDISAYEKGHYINAGHLDSFCTGGVYENMQVLNCTGCLVLGDPAENTADCTDNHFAHCYYNFNSDGTGSEKGVWIRRGNTNHFSDCSVEGADFGYLLGVPSGSTSGYSSSRNFFTACRAENIKRAEGLINAGTDNQIIGGTVSFWDRANGGTNRFVGTSQPVYDRTLHTTTLGANMGANLTDQTITLTDASGFPVPTGRGVGMLKIDSEYVMYKQGPSGQASVTGNVLNYVYRGCFGTAVAAHTGVGTKVVTEIGQGNGIRMIQTASPIEGRPTANVDSRGQMFWESGASGEGDALWVSAKDEGGNYKWFSPIPLYKLGTPIDADFPSTPSDGQTAVDQTNNKWYVRVNGSWKGVTVA